MAWDKSLSATRRIRSLPPRVWASIYILVIPVAGFAYSVLPAGSFYDSNVTHEADFKHDLLIAADLLTSAIRQQEHGDGTGDPPPLAWPANGIQYGIDPNTVYILNNSINVDTSGNISLVIQGQAQSPPPPTTTRSDVQSAPVSLMGLFNGFVFDEFVTLSNATHEYLSADNGSSFVSYWVSVLNRGAAGGAAVPRPA